MVKINIFRGFSVLAILAFGLFSGVAFAAPGASAPASNVCSFTVSQMPQMTQMTGTYLPGLSGGDCSTAAVAQTAQMTGTYVPASNGGASLGCFLGDPMQFSSMTGTYLPSVATSAC